LIFLLWGFFSSQKTIAAVQNPRHPWRLGGEPSGELG